MLIVRPSAQSFLTATGGHVSGWFCRISLSLAIGAGLGGCAHQTYVGAAPAAGAPPTGFPSDCRAGEVQVMLLGTYHFAGSRTDAIHTPAEDVLTERRQAELDDLVHRLAAWMPDQVAVEWPASFADSTQARFGRYVASGGTRSRNEVEQIGFRLARRLGHRTVFPIDHHMPIGNDSLDVLLERRPDLQGRLDRLMLSLQAEADSVVAVRRETGVVAHLRDINSEDQLRRGNSLAMFGAFLAAGEGTNLGGPQLLARWYERNIVIAHNLTRIASPETRRIVVVIGAGHVPPLRNILHEAPQFCPVSPLEYLG
jgi:hypothetical protein